MIGESRDVGNGVDESLIDKDYILRCILETYTLTFPFNNDSLDYVPW